VPILHTRAPVSTPPLGPGELSGLFICVKVRAVWRCSPQSARLDVVVFWQRPRTSSRFDVATGLTHLGSEVDDDWALAGGLAMGVHSSLTLSARSSLGPARTLRCDHCREEFGIRVHRYWHMHFCSSACMTAYQRRLAPETKVKISELEASRESMAAA